MLERTAAAVDLGCTADFEAPRNRRILVVDDNPAIHEDFQKIFRGSLAGAGDLSETEAAFFGEAPSPETGATVDVEMDSAFQGEEALQRVVAALAENRPYAMAFMDVRMPPGWDGIETAVRIWQRDPHLQIVLCTAYSDYSWESMRAQLGRTDRLVILKKPFDTVEALQLADSLIEKWRTSRQATLKMSALEQAVRRRTRELEEVNQSLQAEIRGRKLLESQLVQAQKLESIGQLAAGIAHEINTPIQYIGDSVEFLRSAVSSIEQVVGEYRQALDSLPESDSGGTLRARLVAAEEAAELPFLHAEIPRAFERTQQGIAHVSKIVRAMKEFSFPDAREQSYSDVNHALQTTLVVARNEYKHVARIETHFGDIPEVKCNISELNQVFLNLIVNAAHAIQESGKCAAAGVISVRTLAAEGLVEIEIGDNGCGIPAENRNKVFDPFFTTKPVGRGTGQGLSIAYATVVQKHGGTLSFESEMGRGTTFRVRVPQEGYAS
ncbi:MAG: response regulator [Proteobacteria bacterium]|nr:response regulator [Pseudomonadota bacterium]